MLNEIQTLSEGIKDGILSGAGEVIGLGLFTVLIGKYALSNHSKQKEKVINHIANVSSSTHSLEDMLKDIGFESKLTDVKKVESSSSMENNIDWPNIRKLNIMIEGKSVDTTVGGLLSNVWSMLDEKNRMIFLLETIVNSSKLNISSSKRAKLIVFQKDIDDYLNEKPEHNRTLWGAKKNFLGFDVYFLNQYGYHNAPDLIDIVHSLLDNHIDIKISPVCP